MSGFAGLVLANHQVGKCRITHHSLYLGPDNVLHLLFDLQIILLDHTRIDRSDHRDRDISLLFLIQGIEIILYLAMKGL